MLKLSKKVEYALISLLHIADSDDGCISSREIAEHYQIPPEMLGKVLQTLKRHDLIDSIQGIKGGYSLSRDLSKINLGQVVEAVDGPVYITPCACEENSCVQESNCNIKSPVIHFQAQLEKLIYGLSLESFKEGAAVRSKVTEV